MVKSSTADVICLFATMTTSIKEKQAKAMCNMLHIQYRVPRCKSVLGDLRLIFQQYRVFWDLVVVVFNMWENEVIPPENLCAMGKKELLQEVR